MDKFSTLPFGPLHSTQAFADVGNTPMQVKLWREAHRMLRLETSNVAIADGDSPRKSI